MNQLELLSTYKFGCEQVHFCFAFPPKLVLNVVNLHELSQLTAAI